MSTGAFRDASAAIERAAMLEHENKQLREEMETLAKLRIEVEELERLRGELAQLRAAARSENETAYVKRLAEERDELAGEVRALRERLAEQERELSRLRFAVKGNATLGSVLERLTRVFRPRHNVVGRDLERRKLVVVAFSDSRAFSCGPRPNACRALRRSPECHPSAKGPATV